MPVDCEESGCGGWGLSSMSKGFVLAGLMGRPRRVSEPVADAAGVKLLVIGMVAALAGAKTAGDLPPPSPSRTNASIVFSIFPPTPFRTMAFLLSSVKPMSRNLASFCSVSVPAAWPWSILTPNIGGDVFRGADWG